MSNRHRKAASSNTQPKGGKQAATTRKLPRGVLRSIQAAAELRMHDRTNALRWIWHHQKTLKAAKRRTFEAPYCPTCKRMAYGNSGPFHGACGTKLDMLTVETETGKVIA